ncbi:unnamed protein product [Orchesella dallaii]|uniref:Uncharacterized protein n=1 Tax=Orchesella dallaii TaxID=48710 RepID=A0ABP1QDZ5_9HEXA
MHGGGRKGREYTPTLTTAGTLAESRQEKVFDHHLSRIFPVVEKERAGHEISSSVRWSSGNMQLSAGTIVIQSSTLSSSDLSCSDSSLVSHNISNCYNCSELFFVASSSSTTSISSILTLNAQSVKGAQRTRVQGGICPRS